MPAANPLAAAEQLLLSMLTPVQRADYRSHRCFTVTGSRGGQYHIDTRSTVSNIQGRVGVRYCVAPLGARTEFEVWALQKILIEADESRFLAVAVPSGAARNRYLLYDEIR